MSNPTEAATEEEIITRGELRVGDAPIDAPEPWESWETKLCLWSIGIGIVALVILGVLVNVFILP